MASKTIAIYNTSLRMGGITKSLICLIKSRSMMNNEIDVFLLEKVNAFPNEKFPSNVRFICINDYNKFPISHLPIQVLKYIVRNYNCNKEYDIVIDYNGYNNICAYLALKTKGKKHICWIHNDYEKRFRYNNKFKCLWILMKSKYQYFDSLVAVSEGAKKAFFNIYRKTDKRIDVIPNIIDVDEIIKLSKEDVQIQNSDKYCLVSVGALCKSKNISRQLEILEQVKRKKYNIALYIIGDGVLKNRLKKMVKIKKLENDVIFLGNQENPYKYMARMDGLILTSLYEGQGIVVREAQVLGLDLFIEKNLKDYNDGIAISMNLVEDIANAKKKMKNINYLMDYQCAIEKKIQKVF